MTESPQKNFSPHNMFVCDNKDIYYCGINTEDDGEPCFWKNKLKHPWAIGSGSDYALGAMMSGLSAKEAVDVAKKIDTLTGGRVRTHKVNRVDNLYI